MLASTRKSLALAVTLALVAPTVTFYAPVIAHAQPKPKPKPLREQLNDEARRQFDAGLELGRHAKWDGARTSFLAAYDASKNPRVLFNVAIAEKELGRYATAIDTFKRELEEGRGQLTAEDENDVRSLIAGLQKYVAALTIDVSEPGADVFVDGDKVGSSPLKGPVNVPLGERRVRATKPGFSEAAESIQLAGGGSGKISLKLAPQERTVMVSIAVAGPKSAIIKIDNREVGRALAGAAYQGQVKVSEEAHEFSAEAPGFVTAKTIAVVKEGAPLNLTLELAMQEQKGKLVVVAKPEGATIEIDGKVVGASRWEGPVDARVHQVAVKKQGFYSWNYDVDVPKGGERAVSATLNEDRNTSFVPWLIGTVLIVGAGATAGYFIFAPKNEDPVKGTLAPFALGTTGVHF